MSMGSSGFVCHGRSVSFGRMVGDGLSDEQVVGGSDGVGSCVFGGLVERNPDEEDVISSALAS